MKYPEALCIPWLLFDVKLAKVEHSSSALMSALRISSCCSWSATRTARMITGQKRVIRGTELDAAQFKAEWDKEDKLLLKALKRRKLKYLAAIFSEEGCQKIKEFVHKDKVNPFFEFLNEENFDEFKRDAQELTLSAFLEKYE